MSARDEIHLEGVKAALAGFEKLVREHEQSWARRGPGCSLPCGICSELAKLRGYLCVRSIEGRDDYEIIDNARRYVAEREPPSPPAPPLVAETADVRRIRQLAKDEADILAALGDDEDAKEIARDHYRRLRLQPFAAPDEALDYAKE